MQSSGRARLVLMVGLWLLTILEVLAMGAAGAAKFVGDVWLQMFEGWGYPPSFTYLVGCAEIGGALLLLVPPVASYAAALLSVIMLGALATLSTTAHATQLGLVPPMVHLAVLALLGRAWWAKRWRPGRGV